MIVDIKKEAQILKIIQEKESVFDSNLRWLERISSIKNIQVDDLDLSLQFNTLKNKIDKRIKHIKSIKKLLKYTPNIEIVYINNLTDCIRMIGELEYIYKKIQLI